MQRHGEVERLRGLEVDHELELGRLHDWQIGRFLTLENSPNVNASLAIRARYVGSVAHQTTSGRKLSKFIYRRNHMTSRQRHELLALTQ
jgi:hypothetical protein